MNNVEFCTCTATDCPNHPSNHDLGCTPCIEKNLNNKEIPGCFFRRAGGEKPTRDWYFEDFAAHINSLHGSNVNMDALNAVMTRRSTRKFSDRMPDRKLIEKVIEAGRFAPSGGNNQTTHFIVFTDKEILTEMAELVSAEFSKMEITEGMYSSLKNSINASKKGGYVFHYAAPVFVVTTNKKGYGNAIADSACALENMMITANALDLGSCWINQLHWLDDNTAIRSYMYRYGLKEDETITGGLIMGYPENGILNRKPLERKGNPVTWAEKGILSCKT